MNIFDDSPFLTMCPLLEVIRLDRTNVDDSSLAQLCASSTFLEILGLAWTSVTDSGLEKYVVNCKRLKVLDVQFCEGVKGRSYKVLDKACPWLRHIHPSNPMMFSF